MGSLSLLWQDLASAFINQAKLEAGNFSNCIKGVVLRMADFVCAPVADSLGADVSVTGNLCCLPTNNRVKDVEDGAIDVRFGRWAFPLLLPFPTVVGLGG
jgi:hypothetical protein